MNEADESALNGQRPNELLQYERVRRNWSREYVAEQIGAPEERMVGRWEREGVRPHPVYRQELCELFGKSARELGFVKKGEVPFWNVPYRRNLFFTGREAILSQVHESLLADKNAALTQPQAISGLGGIGKTQVAVEYAYRYGDEYQAVLWVGADSQEILTSNFAALATWLNLAEKETRDQSKVVDAVRRWLSALSRWLLILDNVDDLQMIGDYLPQKVKGHVLLTTRSQMSGPMAHIIEIGVMGSEEGALFLLRRAKLIAQDDPLDSISYADWTKAKAITQNMGGLPLALDQAGAYIEETKCSLDEYLALYQTHETALLKERGELAKDHPESVVSTLRLSYKNVERANLAAADLLQLCALLHPDAIPEEILTEGASELGPVLGPAAADQFQLNRAIKELLRYSLVRRNGDEKTLTIHRLVQAVLRNEMDKATQRLWAERTVQAVSQAFPEVEFANWQRCDRCLPHARVCATLITGHELVFPKAAQLLCRVGAYLRERAQYKDAEPFLQAALTIYEQTLGQENPDTANSVIELAVAYYYQGKYAEAEPLYQRALALFEQMLGPEHQDVARSLNDLAALYNEQGKYELAEPLLQRALVIIEKAGGPKHPHVAFCLNNLAFLYRSQGQYAIAEPLYQRALAIREEILGPDHPDVAQSLNNLASLYKIQGQYAIAEPLYRRALTIREQALGLDHPTVAFSLDGLGDLYRRQGLYNLAEPLFQRSLTIRETNLGPEHREVAQSLSDLALLYDEQGEYVKAKPLYQRALVIREKVLGPDHSDTTQVLESYNHLLDKIKHSLIANKGPDNDELLHPPRMDGV